MEYISLSAEKAVLGSMLLNNDAKVVASIKLQSEDFSDEKNRIIFEAIKELDIQEINVDPVTLANQLSNAKKLVYVGGEDYLNELMDCVPTVAEVDYHIGIVQDRSLMRHLFAQMGALKSTYETKEIDSVVNFAGECENALMQILKNRRVSNFKTSKEVVEIVKAKLLERAKTKNKNLTGLDTGFSTINNFTHGFQKGDLIILAARPSVGKTALALNFVSKVAVEHKVPVGLFSLEMSGEQIITRLLAINSQLNSGKIPTMDLTPKEKETLFFTAKNIADSPLYIEDTSGISIMSIIDKARELKKREPELGLIVIDYIGLISAGGKRKNDNRQQEVSDISRSLKALAREISAPVLVLSQLSRGVESRNNKRPMLSDLRESGSIEQDADQVFFIYRDDYYDKTRDPNDKHDFTPPPVKTGSDDLSPTELMLQKNRNGKTGVIELVFNKNTGLFYTTEDREEQ